MSKQQPLHLVANLNDLSQVIFKLFVVEKWKSKVLSLILFYNMFVLIKASFSCFHVHW